MTKPVLRTRHGLVALKNRIAIRGFDIVDRRTAAARGLLEWKTELIEALGGDENVSPQKRALVDHAVRTRLFIDHADAWLMEQPTLINKRKRTLLPIVKERQQLVDSLARLLSQLGLERQAKKVEDLRTYLAQKEQEQP